MNSFLILFITVFTFASAAMLPLDEEMGLRILNRERRGDDPKWYGNGGGTGQNQQGTVGLRYPNGAGGQVSYGHAKGYGHDVSVDAMVPIWSKQSRYGDTTLNAGGGVSQHFGGPYGNHMTDKRVGLTLIHRF